MMKKYILTLLALFCSHFMTAQTDGCLIVKEYSPDEWQVIDGHLKYVDMDDDGEWDFYYFADISSSQMSCPILWARNGCCFHANEGEFTYFDNKFYDFATPFNDSTLGWSNDFYGTRICSEHNWIGHYHLDTIVFKSGIRNGQEGEYYYGWMEAYSVVTYNYDSVWFYLARTCFCTIPNYPLRWGQTSLNEGFEENETTAFATIYPNPTNGQFTVMGQYLKSAEVFNALGQCVAAATGEGEGLTVDLNGLPAGVYFVTITDKDGRKCVRKVVKE